MICGHSRASVCTFRWEPPQFTQCSESAYLELSATFRVTMRVRHPHGRSVSKCTRPISRNFLSSCRTLLQQHIQRFFHFLHSFRRTFRGTFRRIVRTKQRVVAKVSLRTQCPWMGLKEGECHDDPVPWLTYAEIGPTNCWWTDSHKLVDRELTSRATENFLKQVSAVAP